MAIHVIHCTHGGEPRWGIVRGGDVTLVPGTFPTTGDFVRGTSTEQLAGLDGETVGLDEVGLRAPVTPNQRFVCQGANYRQHMIESGMDPDAKRYNMIFTKASSCIAPADCDVIRPAEVRFLDYEIELGLVLRDIRGPVTVDEGNLHDFVAGLVIVNDYSARDVQIPQMQFYKGKSYRTFGPVGPYLCLLEPDDIPLIGSLVLELKVDDEIRQRDTTAGLVYGPAETLTELSAVQDFAAGDLLSTGTPSGCALAVPSPFKQRLGALLPEAKKWAIFFAQQEKQPYLQPGQVVEASIRSHDGRIDLGVQRNRIVQGPG